MVDSPANTSQYLSYLPALFGEAVDDNGVSLLGQFLLAFEHILSQKRIFTNRDLANQPALGELLNEIHDYFDPSKTPNGELRRNQINTIGEPKADFLPWLASWVALTLRDDWDVEEKRRFIRGVIPLYKFRGTKQGLERVLQIYTNLEQDDVVNIYEFPDIPHYFQVELTLASVDPIQYRVKQQIAVAIIDQEKPAHTFYSLIIRSVGTIQIGVVSTIGVDTLLGSQPGSATSNESN